MTPMSLSEVAAALTAEGDPVTKDDVYNLERSALRKCLRRLEALGYTKDDVVTRQRELLPIPEINFVEYE